MALLIGVAVAALLEYAMMGRPVPAGGDPGQWLSTSYAYVGLPYPSWIIPGQYPPMLFPLLGALVLIAGGPIPGALSYVAVAAILNGVSLYFLARSLTRRRSTALIAEAIILANPTLLSMFFWGFYPNLLGFVFLNLCLGFLIRFIRSRRPFHLYMFWVMGAAAILTHSLVGLILVAVAGLLVLLAVSVRALPREFYRSRAAVLGFLSFLGSVGGFYATTALLHVPHPNYLQSGAFSHVRNGTAAIFNLVIRPFVPGVKVSAGSAVTLLWVLSALLLLYACGLWLFQRKRMTLGTLTTIALALGPLLLAGIGWEAAVVTDYSRFSYFLVAPLGLGIALTLDRFLTSIGYQSTVPATTGSSAPTPQRRWTLDGNRAALPTGTVVLVWFVLVVVGVATFVSDASLPKYEKETTALGHDRAFLGALHLIEASKIRGTVLTVPGVAKWTRAILVRDAYFPNVEARYTFDPTHLVDEEETYFALTSRYVATDGEVAVSSLGTNLSSGSQSFEFQPAYYGSFTPALSLPLSNLSVAVGRAGTVTTERVTTGGVVDLAPVGPSSFSMTYVETGFTLNVTAFVIQGSPEATLQLVATAAPGYQVQGIAGNLTAKGPLAAGTSDGSFVATPGRYGTALATTVNVTPAYALKLVTTGNHPARPNLAEFRLATPVGSKGRQIEVAFRFTTPGAADLVPGLPPLLTTDQVWGNWTVRFVLYTAGTGGEGYLANLLPNEVSYLEDEYGAKVYGRSGGWVVLLLPPASQLPTGPRPAGDAPNSRG
jgi:hypothetical protein